MSDTTDMPRTGPHRPGPGKRRYGPIDITKPPGEAELDAQPHRGDDADRLSHFTPEQIEIESRTVRFDMTFRDVVRFRDQAEMIAACMAEIIKISRQHDLGSIRQRINARREADSLRRTLARFNGKKPRANTWQDR